MSIQLHLTNESQALEARPTLDQIQIILEHILDESLLHVAHSKDYEEVELLLTDNKQIQELNKTYREKDYATDVLSFPEEAESPSSELPRSLGQIVISIEKTKEQAEELGQTFMEELRFLFTHGVLHLLGFDHMEPEEEKLMLKKAYAILGRRA
jgi:probable rRNA maturation factor